MKKLFKWFGFLIGGFLLLVLVLAIAIPVLFPPAKARALIEKQVATLLNRQVKLEKISVGLFSGLSVSGFQLSEKPDFSKGTFVSSEKFVLHPRLLPLLKKKVFIREIQLLGPTVFVKRHADGKTFNFSDLTTSTGTPKKDISDEKQAGTSPLAFLISKATLESGSLKFVDESPAKQSIEINNLNVTVRNITPVSPIDTTLSFQLKKAGREIGVVFEGVVSVFTSKATIKTLEVNSGQSKFTLSGTVVNFHATPELDVSYSLKGLDKDFIAVFSPSPLPLKWEGALASDGSLKGTTDSLAVASTIDATDAKLVYSDVLNKPSQVPMNVEVNGVVKGMKDLSLSKSSFQLASMNLGLDGTVNNLTGDLPQMNLNVKSNTFDASDLFSYFPIAAPPDTVKISGPIQFGTSIKGTTSSMTFDALRLVLESMTVDGNGKYASKGDIASYVFDLKTTPFALEEISKMVPMLAEYKMGGSGSLVANVVSGPVAKGVMNLKGAVMEASGLKISGINGAVNFLVKDTDLSKTSGNLVAEKLAHSNFLGTNMDLKWELTDITSDLSKISGSATLRQGAGAFQNIQKLTQDVKAAKIVFLPITLMQKFSKTVNSAVKVPSFDNVNYNEILGDYVFKKGLLDITRFQLNGTELAALVKGTVGLAGAQALDLKAQVKLAANLLGGTAGELLKDSDGRSTLDFIIRGTLTDPKTTLELKDIGKKAVDIIREKLESPNAKEEINKLLKGLFK